MSETAAIVQSELAKIHSALDLLHDAVARIDTAQQQMRAQLDNQAEAVQESARLHDATARALSKFTERLDAIGPGFPNSPGRDEDDRDPLAEVAHASSHATLQPMAPNWQGTTAGGSSSGGGGGGRPAAEQRDGLLGGGRPVAGTGDGLMGGGRPNTPHGDSSGRISIPKMSVPRFNGGMASYLEGSDHGLFPHFQY